MHETVEIVLDLVVMGAASVLTFWWLRLSRLFKGGIMGRSFGWAALGIALFGLAEGSHIAWEFGWLGSSEYFSNAHPVLETSFVVILALAMRGFYSAWNTGFSKARSSGTAQGSDSPIR